MPLILTHGWPWTFWDFHKVIGPLSDPAAFGGDAADAFDVVVPSLPGFGFSTPLTKTGLALREITDRWVVLMRDVLGYQRFATQGGDIGAIVSADLGHAYAEHLIGVHVNLAVPLSLELPPASDYSAEEEGWFEKTNTSLSKRVAMLPFKAQNHRQRHTASQTHRLGYVPGSWRNGGPGAIAAGMSNNDLLKMSC